MKKLKIVYQYVFIGMFLFSFVFGVNSLYSQEKMTADEIIEVMTETMNPEQSEGKFKLTIVTSSGDERTFVYKIYSKDSGDKSLMKYLKPSRVKNQAILMTNDADDIWLYFPRTDRTRKLATHAKKQKLEGSDFSYEDLGGSDAFIDDYDALLVGEENKGGKVCYKLELTREENSNAGYSRIVMWVDKETYVPTVIDYYHENDPQLLEKELVTSNIQLIDSIYTPMKIVMYNKLEDTYTKMEIEEVTYDVDLPDHLFTEMGMKE
jgi:outer membrane lipoprotein-sorting protein